MIIALFGPPCVGKTTCGALLAKKINYTFVDLDAYIISKFGTKNRFMDMNPFKFSRDEEYKKLAVEVINLHQDNLVIALPPIGYRSKVKFALNNENILPIELQDTVDNIFDRLVFTDDNDVIMPDSTEYKMMHEDHYTTEIIEDIWYYKNAYKEIPNKYFINGRTPDEVVDDLIRIYSLSTKDNL